MTHDVMNLAPAGIDTTSTTNLQHVSAHPVRRHPMIIRFPETDGRPGMSGSTAQRPTQIG
jgi:hypothetical protein